LNSHAPVAALQFRKHRDAICDLLYLDVWRLAISVFDKEQKNDFVRSDQHFKFSKIQVTLGGHGMSGATLLSKRDVPGRQQDHSQPCRE